MKKIASLSILALIIVQLCAVIIPAVAVDKYALIIGISNYQYVNQWPGISSDMDVKMVKNALLKQGFKEKNIVVMQDKQCTRNAILQAIDDSLIARVKPGDVVIFHFSGHGQRIFDTTGAQQDGFDQSLACYDSPAKFTAGEKDDRHLRGAVLGKELEKLREKLGSKGNLLVVLDACHSGSGTRGLSFTKKRGVDFAYAPTDYNPSKTLKANSQIQGFGLTDDKKHSNLANMVCFYACSPYELNSEYSNDTMGCGSLSYAFQKELSLADSSTSYNALWDRIRLDMANEVPQQTPQKEGDLDCKILGGNALPHANYFNVVSFVRNMYLSDTTVWINCGNINGIDKGTVVAFYPEDTRLTAGKTPICTGTILRTCLSTSLVKVHQLITPPDKIASAWVYVKEISYGLSLTVRLPKGNDKLTSSLQSLFSKPDFSFVKVSDGNADLYLESEGNKVLFLTSDDYRADSLMDWEKSTTDAFQSILLRLAKWKFTKNLVMSSPRDSFNVKLLPIELSTDANNHTGFKHYLDTNSPDIKLHSNGNEGFYMEFTNFTSHPLYINVIDIQPNGVTTLIVPTQDVNVIQVPAYGKSLFTNITQVGPPLGTEITKFICSDSIFDLSPVFNSGNKRGVGPGNAFQMLYETATTNKTRGVLSLGHEVGIKTLTYKIEP